MFQPNIPNWKLFLIILLIIAAIFVDIWFITNAKSDELTECWVLCQTDSWVNARFKPSKKSEELGRLECGDKILTDGKVQNGYLHVYGLWFEMGEGWVKKGYIVYDEPYRPQNIDTYIVSNGRVQARKAINGKRRCWLKNGQEIKVYAISYDWSVTNKGYVQTKFIYTGDDT